jgi:hypothetical protein
MARRNPELSGNIINGLQQGQMFKQRAALAEQQRQQSLKDQLALHQQTRDYDIAHPTPGQPGEFEDALAASGVQPGSPVWTHAMQLRVSNILDPMVMTPYGLMMRSQVTGAQQQIIQSLPPGAKPIGGPTSQASGGFPY